MKNKYNTAMNCLKMNPEKLEQIKAIAEEQSEEEPKLAKTTSKIKIVKSIISIAAVFAIVAGIYSGVHFKIDKVKTETIEAQIGDMVTFKSEAELKKFIEKNRQSKEPVTEAAIAEGNSSSQSIAKSASTASNAAADIHYSGLDDGDYAKTYLQESGVDEADIIKTFGNYIFVVHCDYDQNDNSKYILRVFKAENANVNEVAKIEPKAEKDTEIFIEDIFVSDNKLIINCTKREDKEVYVRNDVDGDENDAVLYATTASYYEGDSADTTSPVADTTAPISDYVIMDYAYPFFNKNNSTLCMIYDISNPENPTKLSEFEQSGYYVASRLIDGTEYIVSSYSIFNEDDEDRLIPFVSSGGKKNNIKAENIAAQKDDDCENYIIVSAINTGDGSAKSESKALIGQSYDVYCSANNLYVYSNEWKTDHNTVNITKVSFEDGISFTASGSVSGFADDSYSFSEQGDNLFLCLNVEKNGKESNVLRVLDKNLKEIAKTDYFATGESIKAVRYIGNYAYVITYEETDPLFVTDISNPTEPKLLGQAKISGFSTMLIDVGSNMLLGIGYSTSASDWDDNMEVTDGIKFALFDVSDPLNPKVFDSREYKNLSSNAQTNPKAFVQNIQKGYYAVPYTDDYDFDKMGAIVLSIENGKLVEKKNFAADCEEAYNSRLTYIGDYYYVFSDNMDIASFQLK